MRSKPETLIKEAERLESEAERRKNDCWMGDHPPSHYLRKEAAEKRLLALLIEQTLQRQGRA